MHGKEDIRINMVVSWDRDPDLHALLSERAPKARADVLRSHASFGLWVRRAGMAIKSTPGLHEATVDAHPPQYPATERPLITAGEAVLDTSVLHGIDLDGLD
jgi:hypothetical protein